jgi:hypothetical protein
MTFIFGVLTGMLVTIGASIIFASDLDKDSDQF